MCVKITYKSASLTTGKSIEQEYEFLEEAHSKSWLDQVSEITKEAKQLAGIKFSSTEHTRKQRKRHGFGGGKRLHVLGKQLRAPGHP